MQIHILLSGTQAETGILEPPHLQERNKTVRTHLASSGSSLSFVSTTSTGESAKQLWFNDDWDWRPRASIRGRPHLLKLKWAWFAAMLLAAFAPPDAPGVEAVASPLPLAPPGGLSCDGDCCCSDSTGDVSMSTDRHTGSTTMGPSRNKSSVCVRARDRAMDGSLGSKDAKQLGVSRRRQERRHNHGRFGKVGCCRGV